MIRKNLSVPLAVLIIFIFLANFAAMKFYWYMAIPWLDMLMHFLGGFWLSLFIIYIFVPENVLLKNALKVLGGVIFVGVLWEIFEVSVNTITIRDHFDIIDTLSDLFFDLFGGAVSVYLSGKIIYNDKDVGNG